MLKHNADKLRESSLNTNFNSHFEELFWKTNWKADFALQAAET